MTKREQRIIEMKKAYDYCIVCCKRAGSWYYNCKPVKRYGRHGSGKLISSVKYREYRSWKHTRDHQWKP